jgi:chromosome segregation ATPase
MEKIKEEIGEAMKKIDGDKIKAQLDMALKEVDMAKIQKELQESLAKVDLDQVKKQMNEAMKNVDMAKIQQELQESMSKVKWDEIKAEMDKVKNIDMKKIDEEMKKVKEEMNDLQPKLEKELGKAKVGLEKAKTTIAEFKGFVDGLEKDGLISKKEGYTLKHKEGELFINGKKASEQTYSKYRDFLEKHKKFSIEKSDDDFDIDMD